MRTLLILMLLLSFVAGAPTAATLWWISRNLPDYRKLVNYHSPPGQPFISIVAIPRLVIDAFLSAEDADFYHHSGIDVAMVLRAMVVDIFRFASDRRPIGASTITQQLVKNLLLTDQVSIKRKIKEGMLALRIERILSKDRILELYLNEIYLGCGAHRLSEAASNYFGKTVGALTIEEAVFLAGLPKAPNHYNPLRFPEAAKARRDWVLDRMLEAGYLTVEQATAAKAMPIRLRNGGHCLIK
jgi:penicillin-binding protein 1A